MGRVLNGNAIYSMPSIIYKKAACQLHFELTGSLSHIDFMFLAFLDHLHKLRPDGVLGPADAPVGKDAGAFPIRIALDQVGVIFHLVFKAAFLFLLLGADPAVSRHPKALPPVLVLQERVCRDFPNLFASANFFFHSAFPLYDHLII